MATTSNISSAWTKLGRENWKCFAGTRLCANGKLLREMRPDGTLFCRVSWISAPRSYFFDVFREMLVGCPVFAFLVIWFSIFRLRRYIGFACVGADASFHVLRFRQIYLSARIA